MVMFNGIRRFAGTILLDLPLYIRALVAGRRGYLRVRNRAERLVLAQDHHGVRCDWQWTSELYATKVFPWLGRLLVRRALLDHPIRSDDPTTHNAKSPDLPKVTFIIGHRGLARVPLLLKTLESVRAQRGATVECVVVEQDDSPKLAGKLPSWVKYVFSESPKQSAYARSSAFNVGAANAAGDVYILHDNDLLVPEDYAAETLQRMEEGYEVINLKRFIFYASEQDTAKIIANRLALTNLSPDAVMQNALGGGSIAITAKAFFEIGGMDDAFVGWGGEDNEFWDRALTRKVWHFGYVSLLHLWHPSQPMKYDPNNPTLALFNQLMTIPTAQRIAALASRRALLIGKSQQ
jgi:N-terminal domain of galactosyltransferase